jgi:kinesin family protein 2/24
MAEASHTTFDPTEWAEKRRQAIARASELREQRRRPIKVGRDTSVDNVRIVRRTESRDSASTEGGGVAVPLAPKKWEIDLKPKSAGVRRPPLPSGRSATARVRAVTSPAGKRLLGQAPPVRKISPAAVAARRPLSSTKRREAIPVGKRPPPAPVSSRADPVTRQMIDRDTLRLENKAMFTKAIALWRSTCNIDPPITEALGSRVQVHVRKRPLFVRESFQGREYDVVTVSHPKMIVTHNCLFQADLKTPYMMHTAFTCFTGCFSESATNEEVFALAGKDQVRHAVEGGISTLFCFGQTGSGKTYTMTALQEMTSFSIFSGESATLCQVQFVELCGKKVFDLLSEEKPAVKLREAGDGRLVLDGASRVSVSNARDLFSLMETAQDKRNTESTGANDVSSRSHVVGIISIPETGGKLTLVDLAGSERRKDSMWHDKERQKEGAEINASIHALKECIRGAGTGGFRQSTLTRILAESFTNPKALLSVIATVSPCATDIEHTNSTLKTVHQLIHQPGEGMTEIKQTEMFPSGSKKQSVDDDILPHPKKWTPEQVQLWLAREGENDCSSISKSTTGAMLVRMPESRFIQACNGDEKRGSKLFRSLHALIVQRTHS